MNANSSNNPAKAKASKTQHRNVLAVNEHAALCAVAEAAQPALEELQDLADNGIERTFAEGSLADNGKVVVMLDAATLSRLTEALAQLAAVRNEGGI